MSLEFNFFKKKFSSLSSFPGPSSSRKPDSSEGNILSLTYSHLTCGPSRGREDRTNSESSIDVYTLPCVEEMAHGELLGSPGSSARHSVMAWRGGRETQQRRDVCIHKPVCRSRSKVRTGHGTTNWFHMGKGVCQGCILLPCLFNLYAEYIIRNARLDEE